MNIVGLDLQTQGCTPGVLWQDRTGPTGVITLTCGASFSNATRDTLLIAAAAEYPDGRLVVEAMAWELHPGSTALTLPAPPTGAYWVLATETTYQRNYGVVAAALGGIALWGLAGWGAGDILGRAVDGVRAKRRGR